MPVLKPILVVDDEVRIRELMGELLKLKNLDSILAKDSEEAFELFLKHQPQIAFIDIYLPKMSGIELMTKILEHDPSVTVVIITGAATIDTAVEAMKKGAYDFIKKPIDIHDISLQIDRIIKIQSLVTEKIVLQQQLNELFGFQNFVGNSPPMRKVFEQIKQVANTDSTVLITGESGTGKELVAHALHYSSHRKGKAFVKVNCAALPEGIIESELFGHEKGAFTSALVKRIGRFELADDGTLFLDEIGDLPPSTQVKLLRVIEAKEFERLGGNETIKVNVRLLTATNRDLEAAIKEHKFRGDLFFRLNVINIKIPPLYERKQDIPLLVQHYIKKFASEMNKPVEKVSKKALEILNRYQWPGNVRELVNTIERAVVFCKGPVITENDLPVKMQKDTYGNGVYLNLPSYSLKTAEKTLIEMALSESNWNLLKAAKILKISRGTLYSKMEKYDIENEEK